jgi:hypothetical protein
MSKHDEIKQRERDTWASVADGWKRRDELLQSIVKAAGFRDVVL